jgi:hypothetical protein
MWDHLLIPFVTRVSGWGVAVAGLLLYPGLGLLLPLYLDWSTSWLVSMNLIGVTFAAVVSLGWLFVQLEAKDRRHLVEWTTNLRLLSAEEFEWMVGELFRREGWNVRETGRHDGPDGNIDLELIKGGEHRIVQCKRWTSWQVGVNDIRNFAGTLLREGLPGNKGTFVTLSDFTEQARGEARRTGIALVDRRDLYARVEEARRAEPCPVCQSPMVLGRSPHGWWFRCVTDGCTGKRDLGNEPGRAVELMTQPPALTAVEPGED